MEMSDKNKSDIKKIMESNSRLREKLFARGFIFTNQAINQDGYPFYGIWKSSQIEEYHLLVSPKQSFYIRSNNVGTIVFIGHAYNPFRMQEREEIILDSLITKKFASDDFWNELHELTGVFTLIYIDRDGVYVIGDPTCMQTTFYGYLNGYIYIFPYELAW